MRFILCVFLVGIAPSYLLSGEGSDGGIPSPGESVFDGDFGPVISADSGATVVSSLPAAAFVRTVAREDIEAAGSPDIPTLLRDVLGVNLTSYGAYGSPSLVTLRGFDSARVAVLIDGSSANSPVTGTFDFAAVPVSSVQRIDVTYGPSDSGPPLSGSMGGVINIITLKKNQSGVQVAASLANTSYIPGPTASRDGSPSPPRYEDLADTQKFSVSASYGGDRISLNAAVTADRAGNHYRYEHYSGETFRKESNEAADAAASVNALFTLPGGASTLGASALAYGGLKNIPDGPYALSYSRQTDSALRFRLFLDTPLLTDTAAAEGSLGYDTAESGTDYELSRNHTLNAATRWTFYLTDRVTLKTAAHAAYTVLDSPAMGARNRLAGGASLGGEFLFGPKNPRSPGAFLLVPSLKAVSAGGVVVPLPKIGFSWKAADGAALRGNVYRCFKYPDLEDLYWNSAGMTGNSGLKNEEGWGTDVGITVDGPSAFPFNAAVTAFYQTLSDSIHWYNTSGAWHPENVGKAVFSGFHSNAAFSIPLSAGVFRAFSVSLNYQYLHTRLLSYGYTYADARSVPYTPAHTLAASAALHWSIASGPGSAVFSAHYETLRYADTANLLSLPPYALADFSAGQSLNRSFTAFASVRNLFNVSYQSFADYPMPGTTLTVGLRFKTEPAAR